MLHLIQPRPQRIFLLKEDGNEGEFDGDVHFRKYPLWANLVQKIKAVCLT